MSGTKSRVRVVYAGDVQGVGFRWTVRNLAQGLGLDGGVENRPNGTVELVAEGGEPQLKWLLRQIRMSRLGPHIDSEQVEWGEARGLSGFYYR